MYVCAVGGPVATCMWVSLHNTIREIDAEKKIRYCKCPSIVCDYSHHIYIILNCITRHACITHTCIDTDCLAYDTAKMTSQNDITQVKIGDDIIKHIPVMLRIPVSSDYPQKIISYTCSHTG